MRETKTFTLSQRPSRKTKEEINFTTEKAFQWRHL